MGEVLEITSPDQLELPPPDRYRPPGRWRPAAGIALLLVLAASGGYAIMRPAPVAKSADPAPTVSPTAPSPVEPNMSPAEEPALLAVRDALAAWGEFSRTGGLSAVALTFDADGPQMRRFQDEVSALGAAPSAGFSSVLRDSTIRTGATSEERLVDATLEVRRLNEEPELARWRFVLRQAEDGRWLVWTVVDEETP